MTAYYNEIDPYAAEWLRNLIKAGHIAPGVVDERSIEDVCPSDLSEFTQCHFFAGIGVWSFALRNAGWPDDRPVWTGSCPCQPFSAAGKGTGFDDERHLWPAWHWLISQCEPSLLFGEQVASKDAEPWLDLVSTDLEGLGFTFGAVAFPSASVGAPHIRDRTYWLAHAKSYRYERSGQFDQPARRQGATHSGAAGRVGDADNARLEGRRLSAERARELFAGKTGVAGHWRDADWLLCRDGKYRPVEPGTFPLAHGATSRVGRLRAYGNAINASQAEIFIRSAAEAIEAYDLI